MKRNNKITFSALMGALAVVVMLGAYFPYLTYGIPAVAGLFIMAVVIEVDCKWAFLAYASSAFLVFLTAEKESMLMYVFFLGYYPIVKALLEKMKKPVLEWILKLLLFNVAVLTVYFLFAGLFGISLEDFGAFGKYGALILLGFGNIVFFLYDIAVSRMAGFYFGVVRPKFKRILK